MCLHAAALWLALAGFLAAAPAPAQERLSFRHITADDGLSNNTVRGIVQDRLGFLWFGTEDGLNRYDGYSFTAYRHLPQDPGTIGDDFIWALSLAPDGGIWIGTNVGGLSRCDPATRRFRVWAHDPARPGSLSDNNVRSVCAAPDGTVWAGTQAGGLNRLDPATGSCRVYRHHPGIPGSLAHDTVLALCVDRSGTLWAGTNNGLDRWDPAHGGFVHFQPDPADPGSLSHPVVMAILEDDAGALWVGTEGGLNRLDRASGRFTRFRHDPRDPGSLPHDNVISLYQDRQGRLWVGTLGGAALLDRSAGRFRSFRNEPSRPDSFGNNMAITAFEDDGGTLWFGTGGGISRYNPYNCRFGRISPDPGDANSLGAPIVRSILMDRAGLLWVGFVDGGLDRIDLPAGRFTHWRNRPADPASLSRDMVSTLCEDRQGRLWVGTWGSGLDRMDRARGTFTHYRSRADDPATLSSDIVQAIVEDPAGNLWIGTENGLNRMDPATGRTTRFRHDPSDAGTLSDNRVQSGALCFDRTGALWVGTWQGLNRLDPATLRFTRYDRNPDDPRSLGDSRITAVIESADGRIWVGTYGGGLHVLGIDRRSFMRYTVADGLPSNMVYCIQEDADSRLWLSTNNGLSRFDPRSRTFRNYDVTDGLQSNQFFWGASGRSPDGRLFFGGVRGLNVFDPKTIRDNPHVPPVVLTAFRKFDQPMDLGAGLARESVITLDHTDNFFSFEFAALDFVEPSRNQYAYRLEGFDRDWIRCGTRRYASYTNIGGGEYVFRVRAANNDGVWNQAGASVRIRVRPPFWATAWFQLLAVLALAGLLLGGYQWRIRRVLARQRELAALVSERTRQLEAKNIALAARRDELETIDKIVASINAGIQFSDVLDAIVRETAILPGAERASFLVLDRAAGVFRFQALRGWPDGARRKAALPPEEAARRFLAGADEIFPDIYLAQARPDQPPSEEDTLGGRIRSRLTLRIPVERRVEGYLLLENQIDPSAFAHADILLLRSLKEHIQAAFIKARILDELRLLNEKKNEFLGLAAHDLRNPLGAMINRIGLLQRQVREGRLAAAGVDDLERLLRAAEQMQAMINELLDLSAIESGRLTLCRQPESVASLLSESGAFYQRIAEQKNIHLEVNPGHDLPPVPMDKARLLEVMDNLLSNAIKFTYPGGSIRVWPELEARAVRIHVSDTGQGLDEADLKDVFTGFKKLSARPTGGESSTGLGLAIVKKIVEAHGGTVGVRSRKGEGAVFTVSLPRVEEKCGDCPSPGPECSAESQIR